MFFGCYVMCIFFYIDVGFGYVIRFGQKVFNKSDVKEVFISIYKYLEYLILERFILEISFYVERSLVSYLCGWFMWRRIKVFSFSFN